MEVLLAAPGMASACGTDPGAPAPPPSRDGTIEDPLVISIATAAAVDAAFLGLDIAYGAGGRTLPHAAAVVQAIVGVANLMGVTVAAFGGLLNAGNSCGTGQRTIAMWGFAASLSALGGWLLSHAIWSLRVPEEPRVSPSVVVGRTGALLGLRIGF
jgi:hypothetical protein